jgi:DNA replication protein DnaC
MTNTISFEEGFKDWFYKNIPKRFSSINNKDIPDSINLDILDNNKGLYIWGDCGVGKTHVAYAIFAKLSYKYFKDNGGSSNYWTSTIGFWHWQEILRLLRPSSDPKKESWTVKEDFNPKILIIDDLGSEKATDWSIEQMYYLINLRYENMKPLVITSNFSLKELGEKVGDRIPSRIAEMCEVIKLKGKDRRIK